MKRELPMDAFCEREGYCDGCEDPERDIAGPFVTLAIGSFASGKKRVTLCMQCLPRIAELATFAMAKYEGEVRR